MWQSWRNSSAAAATDSPPAPLSTPLWTMPVRACWPPSARPSKCFRDRPTCWSSVPCGTYTSFHAPRSPFCRSPDAGGFSLLCWHRLLLGARAIARPAGHTGQVLPGEEEVIATYHGKNGMGVLERLITADENLPLTGTGSMARRSRAVHWIGTMTCSRIKRSRNSRHPFRPISRTRRSKTSGTSWTRRKRRRKSRKFNR